MLDWSAVYDLCLWYCVEGSSGYHNVTDYFADFSYLDPDEPEEGISGPYPNDHDCLKV